MKNTEFQIPETKLSLLALEVSHAVSQPTCPTPPLSRPLLPLPPSAHAVNPKASYGGGGGTRWIGAQESFPACGTTANLQRPPSRDSLRLLWAEQARRKPGRMLALLGFRELLLGHSFLWFEPKKQEG